MEEIEGRGRGGEGRHREGGRDAPDACQPQWTLCVAFVTEPQRSAFTTFDSTPPQKTQPTSHTAKIKTDDSPTTDSTGWGMWIGLVWVWSVASRVGLGFGVILFVLLPG